MCIIDLLADLESISTAQLEDVEEIFADIQGAMNETRRNGRTDEVAMKQEYERMPLYKCTESTSPRRGGHLSFTRNMMEQTVVTRFVS